MTPQGYALHIGLNAVDPASYEGWSGELFACENDVSIYKSLAEKAGFQSIHVLLTKDATSKNVLQQLQDAAALLQTGDMLLLTYSGHGGAIPDINQDETDNFGEMSGFDETWCLYDRQLLDDELKNAFSKFREGVRILVFSDSCHSGSISKAAEEVPVNNNTDPFTIPRARALPLDVLIPVYNNHKQEYNDIQSQLKVRIEDIPAYVVQFGACQDDELALEVSGNGMFTAKVQKVLSDGGVGSYKDLLSAVRRGFPGQQEPNLFHYGRTAYAFLDEKPFCVDVAGGGV